MSHNQFPPPQQCHEWSDVEPDGRALRISATVSGVVQLVELPVCSSLSADVQLVLNQACH
jgi:hypothetical protein